MPYTVTTLPNANSEVKELAARAAKLGLHGQLTEAIERIMNELANRPMEWGEPEFRLVHADGVVCHGIEDPLVVRFAVYETAKVVCVFKIVPLSRSPLAQP